MKPYYSDNLTTLYNCDYRDHPLNRGTTVITDPPYNVGYHYREYNDRLRDDEYLNMILPLIEGRPCVMIHYMEELIRFSSALDKIPEKVVAWVYPSNTTRQWRGIAWWGVKPDFRKAGQPYRNPTDKRIRELMEAGKEARLYDWWEINQVKNVSKEKTGHPCQIPYEVMDRIVKITAPEHVTDPFAGSGTTLLACRNHGIPCVGFEIDREYCDIIINRLNNHGTQNIL